MGGHDKSRRKQKEKKNENTYYWPTTLLIFASQRNFLIYKIQGEKNTCDVDGSRFRYDCPTS